jgi:hypothetical protein
VKTFREYREQARNVCIVSSLVALAGFVVVFINLPASLLGFWPVFYAVLMAIESGEAWQRWTREDAAAGRR